MIMPHSSNAGCRPTDGKHCPQQAEEGSSGSMVPCAACFRCRQADGKSIADMAKLCCTSAPPPERACAVAKHCRSLNGPHQKVVGIVQRRLLIIEGREAHALEVAPVPLLSPHHDPHGTPLSYVHRLYDPRYLIHKADGSRDVVEHPDMLDLSRDKVDVSSCCQGSTDDAKLRPGALLR